MNQDILTQEKDANGDIVISENPENEVNGIVSRIQNELKTSPEVHAMTKEIDMRDHASLLEYGGGPANEVASFADRILKTVSKGSVEDSGIMMKELAKLMKSFDPKDFEKEGGLIAKIFGSAKKAIEKLLDKYKTVGGEIDKIYREISKYKSEISKSNNILEELFSKNLEYYQQIEKYVVAGNMVVERLKTEELPKLEEAAANGNQMNVVQLETFNNGVEMLEQRIYDLEMAKMVALQTAPQIRLIQKGNFKLIGKIQSAFVVTIPIFKIGLVQALSLKRQKLVADSMQALDDATNELLLRNAQNTASQSTQIAKLSGGSVKMETLEQTWKTILAGIDETKQIEEDNAKQRAAGTQRIHELQEEVMGKLK